MAFFSDGKVCIFKNIYWHVNTLTKMAAITQLYHYVSEGYNLACQHYMLTPKYDAAGSKYPMEESENKYRS